LIQQRAADKITFPNVWTNTCCSHPLFGFSPSEVDDPALGEEGMGLGAKAAAVRKLEHELGISSDQVTVHRFKFLTRLHYWAADVLTHGEKSPWGENEIDYILFIKCNVDINPNPEEVQDTKYVSSEELISMMDPDSRLLWSPWFKIIAKELLIPKWWPNLDETLTTNKHVDCKRIYRFDPSEEFMGGLGEAGAWLGLVHEEYGAFENSGTVGAAVHLGDQGRKQGAYGKVPIHKHHVLSQLVRIDEIFAGLWLMYVSPTPNKIDLTYSDVAFCNDMLGKVSRSFASVIRQLPQGLCLDILVFYLVLRALDTIEDDMEAFKGKEHEKIVYLQSFHRIALLEDEWNLHGVGEGDERVLLENFQRCQSVFKSLPEISRKVIAEIACRMGNGMADFVRRDLGQGTVTVKDYNLYCHYVAGLIGEGLSVLFHSSGYESVAVARVAKTTANTMGLFLQKTNIIRDYLEDFVDGRAFWPQEIWKEYALTKDLGDFIPSNYSRFGTSAADVLAGRTQALSCLNHLVADALQCVPEVLEYMSLIRNPDIFKFCAIPQVGYSCSARAAHPLLHASSRAFT